jgi:hypothetical protein
VIDDASLKEMIALYQAADQVCRKHLTHDIGAVSHIAQGHHTLHYASGGS